MSGESNCDACMNYIYDEEYECYICDMDLDQDGMGRFLRKVQAAEAQEHEQHAAPRA